MTDGVQQLKSALGDIPSLLLDDELVSIRDEAIASVDELEVFAPDPAVIVVVGAAGAGKSSVVNAIVGSEVAAVAPLRPTTTSVSAIGGSEASLVAGATEFVVTDAVPEGLVVVDTPPWDMAGGALESIVREADLVVVVVTPARYGDEQTAQTLSAAKAAKDWCLVVNRLPASEGDREQLLDAIHERLGVAPSYAVVEGEPVEVDGVGDSVELDASAVTRRANLASTAGKAARRVASSLTERATEVGNLAAAVSGVEPPTFESLSFDDAVEWSAARADLVELALDGVATWERMVVAEADSGLGRRVAGVVDAPDGKSVGAQLDAWRTDTSERFRRRSTIWFRKKSGHELLDRWSWITAANPSEPLPRRVRRMMGDALEPTSRQARAELVGILAGFVAGRATVWNDVVDRAGAYRPGMLLIAADMVDPSASDANQADD